MDSHNATVPGALGSARSPIARTRAFHAAGPAPAGARLAPDAVLAKTAAGRQALSAGPAGFQGRRAQRSLLILIDGHKPLRDLQPALAALGLGSDDLWHLVEAGYAEIAAPPARAEAPVDLPLQIDPSDHAPAPRRSLVAAKFYALDLLTRMLGRGDAELREQARHVHTAADLLAWIERCTAHLAEVAGREPAALFHERTLALMPDHAQ